MDAVLSSSDIQGDKADGQELEIIWRSEMPVDPHSRGLYLSCKWDYLWIMPIWSPPTAIRFCHWGRVLSLFSRGAALPSDRAG